MQSYINSVTPAIKAVYHKKYPWIVTAIAALLIFSLNIIVINLPLLFKQFSFKLLWYLIIGGVVIAKPSSLAVLTLIALLGGVVISMSMFLVARQVQSSAAHGIFGLLITTIIPACPSCTLGVISLIGLGGIFSILPFKGLELGWIVLLLLIGSILFLSKKVLGVCSVRKH